MVDGAAPQMCMVPPALRMRAANAVCVGPIVCRGATHVRPAAAGSDVSPAQWSLSQCDKTIGGVALQQKRKGTGRVFRLPYTPQFDEY
jgi:hypothetical protein